MKRCDHVEYVIEKILMDVCVWNNGFTLLTDAAGSGKSFETAIMIAKKMIRMDRARFYQSESFKAVSRKDKEKLMNCVYEELIETTVNKEVRNAAIKGYEELLESQNFSTDICKIIDYVEPKRDIYYITPRIKNVSDIYKEIGNALEMFDRTDLKSEILKIDSLRRTVMDNSDNLLNDVTREWGETHQLNNIIKQINKSVTASGVNLPIEMMLFDGKDSPEYRFRKKLRKSFRNEYKNFGKNKDAYDYMISSKWKFIKDIYPSALSEKKHVFILTSKKFFMKNDPIISPAYFFTKKENIENAIVFIDEIDAIKTDLVDDIIDNSLDNDIMDMFKVFYKAFSRLEEIDTEVIEATNSWKHIMAMKEQIEEVKNKYFPDKWEVKLFDSTKNGKLEKEMSDIKILNYQGIHSYYDFEKNYKYIPYKDAEHKATEAAYACNKILPKYIGEEHQLEGYSISEFLGEIRRCVYRFSRVIFNIASEYVRYVEAHKEQYTHTIEEKDGISTVYAKINVDRDNAVKFADMTMSLMRYQRYKKEKQDRHLVDSFYGKGLFYSSVLERKAFLQSDILQSYEIPYTPELMLLDLAMKAHVIGISATAEVESVNNFNLEFFEEYLGDKFRRICQNPFYRERLSWDYEEKNIGYRNSDTIIKKVEVDSENDVYTDLATLYFSNKVTKEDIRKIKNNIEVDALLDMQANLSESLWEAKNCHNTSVLYDYQRLKKVWNYIKQIMEINKKDGVITNGIVITQKNLKEHVSNKTQDIYTLEYVKMGAMYICAGVYNISFQEAWEKVQDMFVVITALDLKEGRNRIRKEKNDIFVKKFQDKECVFMMTSYASVSRGNNLQIKIGKDSVQKGLDDGTYIKINDWNNKGYVDWDSIYIEKPTHVIPALRGENNEESESYTPQYTEKLKVFLTIEELAAHHQLDRYEKNRVLAEVFEAFNTSRKYFGRYTQLYTSGSVLAAYTVNVYQTIGRISRTNIKKRYNGIFYDSELISSMETRKDKLNISIMTVEFKRFLEDINYEKLKLQEAIEKEACEKFGKQNLRIGLAIAQFLDLGNNTKEKWTDELQTIWEAFRKLALKHPVISKKELRRVRKNFNAFPILKRIGWDVNDMYLRFKKPVKKYYFGECIGDISSALDFMKVYVSDKPKVYASPSKNCPFEVSRDASRLSMLLNAPEVKAYWRERHFNMDWETGDGEEIYGILCPVVYNNIYKGAIGEEVVKTMLRTIGIRCEEIRDPEVYEKFDFVFYKNDKKFYVDAKNFAESSLTQDIANECLKEKICTKLQKVDLDHAFIINIIDETNSRKVLPMIKVTAIPGLFTAQKLNDCQLIERKLFDGHKETILDRINDKILSVCQEKQEDREDERLDEK